MADGLLTAGIRMPGAWYTDDDAETEPTPFRMPGVDVRPEWRGKHEHGSSKLVVFSVRLSPKTSMEALREGLKRDVMAEPGHASGDALAWVSHIDGEYFPAIMRTPAGGGRPLIWLARLSEEAVPDRFPEILSAIEATEWEWA